MKLQNRYFHLIIAISVLIFDQVTKLLVRDYFAGTERYSVVPVIKDFFNLRLVENHGMIWGLFSEHGEKSSGTLIIAAVSVVALTVLIYIYFKTDDRYETTAMAMIIGGAAGNIIDRVFLGAVTDFIDLYVGKSHWPAFNIADSFINIGVVMMLLVILFRNRKEETL